MVERIDVSVRRKLQLIADVLTAHTRTLLRAAILGWMGPWSAAGRRLET